MPKVSDEHRASQRAAILDAARRCFASNGFHATSMQDILDEAGKSAGAVYRYFPGKSDIVGAIAEQSGDGMLDALAAYAESAGVTVADVITSAVAGVRAKHQALSNARVSMQVWAESVRDPRMHEQFTCTHERVRGIVAALIRRRHPELDTQADTVAGAAVALVPGFVLQLGLLDDARTADFELGIRGLLGDL